MGTSLRRSRRPCLRSCVPWALTEAPANNPLQRTRRSFESHRLQNTPLASPSQTDWTNRAAKRLEWYEQRQLKQGQTAYVIVTNMAFHRSLESVEAGQAIMAHGLGNNFWLPGPRRLADVYRRKQKHIDIHNLCQACAEYPQIPTTFDGSLSSELRGKGSSIRIGQSYF
jgi:hypothetical protein